MRWRAIIALLCAVTLLLLALGAALGGIAGAATTVNAGISGGLTDDEILQIAQDFAAVNGETDPQSITSVATTQKEAVDLAMPGDNVGGAYTSDLIVITGDFTGYGAKIPPGAAPPTGSVISVVIDAMTGEVSDWSLNDDEPDLETLGTATVLSA